jgi:hypothetical protein
MGGALVGDDSEQDLRMRMRLGVWQYTKMRKGLPDAVAHRGRRLSSGVAMARHCSDGWDEADSTPRAAPSQDEALGPAHKGTRGREGVVNGSTWSVEENRAQRHSSWGNVSTGWGCVDTRQSPYIAP